MNNRDYVFHINWEDRHKQLYRVGFLAQLDENFYLIIKDEENAQLAYRNGFIGVPGFRTEEVYKSKELFDFFKSRILQTNSKNPCEELSLTKAKSMIDSYSVEEITEKVAKKYKTIILEAYELQERKKKIHEAENVDSNNEEIKDSNSSHEEIN